MKLGVPSFLSDIFTRSKGERDAPPVLELVHIQGRFSEQSDPSLSFDPTSIYRTRGYKMSIKSGTNRPTLFRFLLAKLVYEEADSGLSVEEYLVLCELYLSLTLSTDPSVVEKYGSDLKGLEPLFHKLHEVTSFPIRLENEFRTELKLQLQQRIGLFPSPQAYFGLRGSRDLRRSFLVTFRSSLFPKVPNKRYIGVGYKDKGTRRNPATNGTPSWQEVASLDLDGEFRVGEEAEGSMLPSLPQGREDS